MDIWGPRLAATLRWLAVVWMVAWALYVAFWDGGRLATVEDMAIAVAALLIPAVLVFALSWGVERISKADRTSHSRAAPAGEGRIDR